MKKKCLYLLIPVLWLSLSAALWFGPRQEISQWERRKLQQFPQANAASLLSGRFMSQFERF